MLLIKYNIKNKFNIFFTKKIAGLNRICAIILVPLHFNLGK